MIFTKEMKRVDIKSNTIKGIKLLFNISLYRSHTILCPPAEHNVKLVMLSWIVSKLRRFTTKWINTDIALIP